MTSPRSEPTPASVLANDSFLAGLPDIDGFKILGPCLVYGLLGRGGMGRVYRGKHLKFDIDMAIKCMDRGLAEGDPRFVERFKREARLAAAVTSENLIRVYETGEERGVHYLVMEFVAGETARDRVRRKGALRVEEALAILLGATRGLATAHRAGIVHRDIKPDNILISRAGEVKVSDLGLAKLGTSGDMTSSQEILGTPSYMPPEQWRDLKSVGPAGDVYSLGATLFFLLAAEGGIQGQSPSEIMHKVLEEGFPAVRARLPDIPEDLAAVIQKCTERDPGARYADAGELHRVLAAIASSHANLEDREAGAGGAAALVSPPPAATLARARREFGGDDSTATSPPSARTSAAGVERTVGTTRMAPPASSHAGRNAVVVALTGMVVVAVVAVAIWGLPGDRDSPPVPPETSQSGEKAPVGDQPSSAIFSATGLRPREVVPSSDPSKVADSEALDPKGSQVPAPANDMDRAQSSLVAAIHVVEPAVGVVTASRRVQVALRIEREDVDEVLIAGEPAVKHAGRYERTLEMDQDGERMVTIEARTSGGVTATHEFPIAVDTAPPELAVSELPELNEAGSVTLTGSFTDSSACTVFVNGQPVRDVREGGFACSVDVRAPETALTIQVVDAAGHVTEKVITVRIQPPYPVFPGFEVADPTPEGPWEYHPEGHPGLRLVLVVPTGPFLMGDPSSSQDKYRVHSVRLESYFIGKYEVSNHEYAIFCDATGHPRPRNPRWDDDYFETRPEFPVLGVTYRDAEAFCTWAGLSLPTEAQWEYAARGEHARRYPWGDALLTGESRFASYSGFERNEDRRSSVETADAELREADGYLYTAEVAGFRKGMGPFGTFQQAGNVAEWCQDVYGPYTLPVAERTGLRAATGPFRVIRGGSWDDDASVLRGVHRESFSEDKSSERVGFRVAALASSP